VVVFLVYHAIRVGWGSNRTGRRLGRLVVARFDFEGRLERDSRPGIEIKQNYKVVQLIKINIFKY
jgi:hypothetical protein